MAARNTRTTHPSMSPQIEQMLATRGIDWEFEANMRIADIRHSEEAQVRLTEHQAPKDQVVKYATAMKHGATFPAIVLNDGFEKIDGNTRLAARIKNGDETIPAYICHGVSALEARSLSVELNQSNGLAMTDVEIRNFIVGAVQEGQHPEIKSLSRMTGVRENKIARWIAEAEFGARAKRDGFEDTLIQSLPSSTRAALQVTRLAPVFRALTLLAAESRMTAAQVKKIVAEVNGASSEADALAIVSAERELRSDDIRARAAGFKPMTERRSKGSAQHIGGLVRFEVEDLLDVAPEKQYETFLRVKTVRDRLDEVVARAEKEWDLTPPPAETPTDDDSEGAAVDVDAPVPAGVS